MKQKMQLQFLQRKAATRRKEKPYSYNIRISFHFRMWELKRFHRKSMQAFHAERIVMFTARDAISGRYFPTITLFTLTLQISDVFQLQKGHPGGGSECRARHILPGTWPQDADLRPERQGQSSLGNFSTSSVELGPGWICWCSS